MKMKIIFLYWSLLLIDGTNGFSSRQTANLSSRKRTKLLVSSSSSSSSTKDTIRAPPRTGFAQTLLNFALESPLWKHILVPQARAKIVTTAEANGIPWNSAKQWIKENCDMTNVIPTTTTTTTAPLDDYYSFPEYYKRSFHAYEEGNLSWEAALEVEIASCAVGARNFPQYGSKGEDAFRGAFENALKEEAGAFVPNGAKILDMGCGTGMSTRRLAKNFPQASTIQGIDLSPYYISIGKQLLKLEPTSFHEGGTWVSTIQNDNRIEYLVGDAGSTGLESNSFDIVNLQFVLHEIPPNAARGIVSEALRVLKPNGQLWICEMDFEAPAYAEQRANALLFALIRSTEPYLDDYAESISSLFQYIQSNFEKVKVVPATGRHFALVATKNGGENENDTNNNSESGGQFEDLRFDANGDYRVEDTHLQVWESKESS